MAGPFNTFGGNVVVPGQVSFAAISLSANLSITWPNFTGGANVVAAIMDVTPSAGSLVITMPDATQAGNGSSMLFRNIGSQTFEVRDSTGASIMTVAAGVAKFLYLRDNTTAAGTWGVITYGTGTSAADATALAGLGLQAITGTLAQSHPAFLTAAAITIGASSLAQNYIATGGSVACNLPTSASMGPNFFFLLKNAGSGTITITPTGGDTVDQAATVALAPNDACLVMSAGNANAWYTIGLGRNVNFAFTQLVKNVAGGVDVTLTSSEASNKVITLVGLLTGNINVIVPNTVSVYYIYNNTTGAFTLTVKTAAGTGLSVAQGSHDIGVCDATNVYRGITNTSGTTLFAVGSAGSPSVSFVANASTGLYVPSSNVLAASANGFEVMSFNGPASSVNWIDAFAAATGNPPLLVANGTDPNVGIGMKTKGTGAITLFDNNGNEIAIFGPAVASAVNEITVKSNATLNNPTITATGGDANVGINLVPKGTGVIQANGVEVVTLTGTQSLSNKTIASPTMTGTVSGGTYTGMTVTNPANTTQALTFVGGGTTTWDANSGHCATLTLTGANTTIGAISNPKTGGTYFIKMTQGDAGGRTAAWNAQFKFSAAVVPPQSVGNGKIDLYAFWYDGSVMQSTGFMLDVR